MSLIIPSNFSALANSISLFPAATTPAPTTTTTDSSDLTQHTTQLFADISSGDHTATRADVEQIRADLKSQTLAAYQQIAQNITSSIHDAVTPDQPKDALSILTQTLLDLNKTSGFLFNATA